MTKIGQTATTEKHFSRRDFLKTSIIAGLIGLETFLLAISGKYYTKEIEPSWVEVTRLQLKLARLPQSFSGFRVVQISDLHLGGWMTIPILTNLLRLVMDQSPDLLVITGDIVMGYNQGYDIPRKLDELVPLLKEISARIPVAGVLGNHDHLYDAAAVSDMLRQAGVKELSNAVMRLHRGAETLTIAGVDDVLETKDRLTYVLNQTTTNECSILLAHEPDFADTSALTRHFDLQLSGHSHGGQVALPFWGPILLPILGRKYPRGLYKVGEMLQYTNRGLGLTSPYIRFNCRPEITVFTLENA